MKRLLGISLALLLASNAAYAQLFVDDFEGDLSQWTGKNAGAHNGVIVPDPLDAGNNVLTFSTLNNTGDAFGLQFPVVPNITYVLSFDYLGLAIQGTPADDTGGTIGFSNGLPGAIQFLAGTIDDNNIVLELIDDGTWHSYTIFFEPFQIMAIPNGMIRVTAEDWDGAACGNCTPGVPGDVFFDNVRLRPMHPIPVENSTWGKVKAMFETE